MTMGTTGHNYNQRDGHTIGICTTTGIYYYYYFAYLYYSDTQFTTRSVRSGKWRLVETSSPGVERLVET